ncbi:hypothetical protein VPH35_094644 [Triticum aestivum]
MLSMANMLILTGMATILAASTVIIVTSVSLSPARIHFSITDANGANSTVDGMAGVSFNFNLTVGNPSHRAGVEYKDVIVNLQLARKRVKRKSVPATVNESMPLSQRPNRPISMAVAAFVEQDLLDLYLKKVHYRDHPTLTIIVTALVHFKVGVTYTRLYDITISCPPVDFFDVFQDGSVINIFPKGNINCSA